MTEHFWHVQIKRGDEMDLLMTGPTKDIDYVYGRIGQMVLSDGIDQIIVYRDDQEYRHYDLHRQEAVKGATTMNTKMNLFAALTLSTKRQACACIPMPGVYIANPQPAYVLRITGGALGYYTIEVFRVTYPGGTGQPQLAETPHVSERVSEDDLRTFLQKRNFDEDAGWQPVEEDTRMVES